MCIVTGWTRAVGVEGKEFVSSVVSAQVSQQSRETRSLCLLSPKICITYTLVITMMIIMMITMTITMMITMMITIMKTMTMMMR